MHLVDGVVEVVDEAVDVAAVERRDEAAPQRELHFGRDVVSQVFVADHRLAKLGNPLPAVEKRAQQFRAFEGNLGVTFEEVEEFLLFWHQGLKPAEHERLREK